MDKWDKRFLDLAAHVAAWSKDPSSKVGAVISARGNTVVALGYNGPPRGVLDNMTDRDVKLRRTIHAEVNALLTANTSVAGCTLYCTHHPCANCAAKIIQSGISRVVCWAPDKLFAERWWDDITEAGLMCAEAGVSLEVLNG